MYKPTSYSNMGLIIVSSFLLIAALLNWDKPAGSTFGILLLVAMFKYAAGQIIDRLDLITKELQDKKGT